MILEVFIFSFEQMIYYVDSLDETIKFYHSLLKNNGRLMIIVEAGKPLKVHEIVFIQFKF